LRATFFQLDDFIEDKKERKTTGPADSWEVKSVNNYLLDKGCRVMVFDILDRQGELWRHFGDQ
jgi:hypothetical protein